MLKQSRYNIVQRNSHSDIRHALIYVTYSSSATTMSYCSIYCSVFYIKDVYYDWLMTNDPSYLFAAYMRHINTGVPLTLGMTIYIPRDEEWYHCTKNLGFERLVANNANSLCFLCTKQCPLVKCF